jgi:hypothetical protein
MVGKVWASFQQLELSHNTLFLFFSDNGPSLRWGASAGSMGIFSGRAAGYPDTGKGSTWEGGLRMPAFAVWPGKITPGSSTAEVISSLDVMPTLLRLADIAAPTARGTTLDGKDFVDLLLDDANGRSKHEFLPFYNEPRIANASSRIFAARIKWDPTDATGCKQVSQGATGLRRASQAGECPPAGQYKVHFISSPGLGGGMYPTVHRPPNETYVTVPNSESGAFAMLFVPLLQPCLPEIFGS